MNNLPVKKMVVLHNNANRDFMHLIWKMYYYELVTGMEKDIHVSHKGQGAATNREKGQGVTRTRAGAAPCKNGLARTLYMYVVHATVHILIFFWRITRPNGTIFGYDTHWMALFQNYICWPCLTFQMITTASDWLKFEN